MHTYLKQIACHFLHHYVYDAILDQSLLHVNDMVVMEHFHIFDLSLLALSLVNNGLLGVCRIDGIKHFHSVSFSVLSLTVIHLIIGIRDVKISNINGL